MITKHLNEKNTNYGLNEEQLFVNIIKKLLQHKLNHGELNKDFIRNDPKLFTLSIYPDLIEKFQKQFIFKKIGERFMKIKSKKITSDFLE